MRTFRSLATEEEYARTQADFVAVFDGAATMIADQVVGVPGWPHSVPRVRYLRAHDMWFAPREIENRNWNGFGIGDPFRARPVTPSIQINLPYGPGGPKLAACFMVDEEGRRCVGHKGRLGGANGVTIAEFLAFYPKDETVRIGATEHQLIMLGCIEEPDVLIAAVADIARAASAFRQQRGGDGGQAQAPDDPDDD